MKKNISLNDLLKLYILFFVPLKPVDHAHNVRFFSFRKGIVVLLCRIGFAARCTRGSVHVAGTFLQ